MTDEISSKYAFIVNPAAKSNRAVRQFEKLKPFILSEFPNAGIFLANNELTIEALCKEAINKYDHIIACGGDGTVHIIGGILYNTDTTLGILPIGSGNDIAFSLEYPKDPIQVLRSLKNYKSGNIDVMNVNGIPGFNTIGIGLDGYINLLANNKLTLFKKARYLVSGAVALTFYRKRNFSFFINEDRLNYRIKGWMLCAANGKREGGRYLISPLSVNDDGLIDFIFLKDINRLKLFKEFIKLSLGYTFDKNIIDHHTARTMTLENAQDYHIHIDGEQYVFNDELNISVDAGGLRVIRP
ncbi:diacylglycerol/lipid kinase family protein [Balneola sp. MJW-20]|uniref:diacylglycerol/lipid kinase family protein n=1 Tax=Gracilimonas aurantiaca TaxID=3234185 RepID=UPI003467EB52